MKRSPLHQVCQWSNVTQYYVIDSRAVEKILCVIKSDPMLSVTTSCYLSTQKDSCSCQSKDFAHTSIQNTYNQTSQQKPNSHSIEKRMGHIDHTRSGKTALYRTTIKSTNHNHRETNGRSTKQPKQTARTSIQKQTMQNKKSEPGKVVSAPQQTTNVWTKPFVPSIMEFSVAMSANRTKRSLSEPSANQYQPVSKLQTKHQQNVEEHMDDVLEIIQISLTGATSLLWKISTGKTRLVPALKKIMEAAMDDINTLTV